MGLRNLWSTLFYFAACICQSQAFAPLAQSRSETSLHIFDKIGEFFEELDAFVDDATSRRLGAGSSFYGKRKSSFYGKEDSGRKRDRKVKDPTGEFEIFRWDKVVISTFLTGPFFHSPGYFSEQIEDYRGPTSSGFFKWMPDENGQLQPVTRMKEKNLSRNVNWEKEYSKKE